MVDGGEDMAILRGSYLSIFQISSLSYEIQQVCSNIRGRLTDVHKLSCSSLFLEEEVNDSIFQMHPNKAPGTDDHPTLFFLEILVHCWKRRH